MGKKKNETQADLVEPFGCKGWAIHVSPVWAASRADLWINSLVTRCLFAETPIRAGSARTIRRLLGSPSHRKRAKWAPSKLMLGRTWAESAYRLCGPFSRAPISIKAEGDGRRWQTPKNSPSTRPSRPEGELPASGAGGGREGSGADREPLRDFISPSLLISLPQLPVFLICFCCRGGPGGSRLVRWRGSLRSCGVWTPTPR